MGWWSDALGTSSIETPGLGPNVMEAFKQPVRGTYLNEGQADRSQEYLSNYLKSSSDPSAAIFEFSRLSNLYPGVKQFQPGSKLYKQTFEAENSPVSTGRADYLSRTMLNQPLTPEMKRLAKQKNLSSYDFAGLLASDRGRASATAFSSPQEENLAEFGRQVWNSDGTSTGKRYATISPLAYTGGIS
jgi:hypothetical protein